METLLASGGLLLLLDRWSKRMIDPHVGDRGVSWGRMLRIARVPGARLGGSPFGSGDSHLAQAALWRRAVLDCGGRVRHGTPLPGIDPRTAPWSESIHDQSRHLHRHRPVVGRDADGSVAEVRGGNAMANDLTGQFDVVAEFSAGAVNRLLAAMHRTERFLHSIT